MLKELLKKISLPEISPRLKSRKLWLALAAAVFPVLNQELGWGLDEDVVMKFILGLFSFIFVEGVADAAERIAK